MENKNLLDLKQGLIIGVAGVGKTYLVRELMDNGTNKCIYISIHNEDFGNIPYITIKEIATDLKNIEIAKIKEYINKNESFVVKVPSSYVGQDLACQYVNEVLLEILEYNKYFTLIIDDTWTVARTKFQETYRKLLEQKSFPVVSIFQHIEDVVYVFDYMEQVYVFRPSGPDYDILEKIAPNEEERKRLYQQEAGQYTVFSV